MFVYLQNNVIMKAIVYKIVLQLIVIVLVVIGVGAKAQYPYNFSFAGFRWTPKRLSAITMTSGRWSIMRRAVEDTSLWWMLLSIMQ